MKMEKIKDIFYKIILIVLFIFVGYVTFCSVFNVYDSTVEVKPIVIIIGIITLTFLFISLKKLTGKIKEKYSNYIALTLCLIFFIILSIFGSFITSVPTYDLSNIQREAMIMLENGGKIVTEEYFARCTNQVPGTILVYFFYYLGNFLQVSDLRIFTTIVHSFFIAVSGFFIFLSVKKLKDYRLALITLVFYIINPIFYIYSSYFYTYTLCIPFASCALYLLIVALKSGKNTLRMLLLIVSGIILALGFEIRVVIGILLIGAILGIILNYKITKKVILNILGLIFGFVIGIGIYTLISMPFNAIENKNLELPITHYIMYSLNEEYDGRWNQKDFDYTFTKETYDKKVEANAIEIKNRLKELGVKGYIELSATKLAVNWSNGDYDYMPKFLNLEKINRLYEYIAGNRKIFLIYCLQIFKATTLFIFLIAVIKEIIKKDRESLYSVIFISTFGAFIFYLLWEVAKSYSLTFLPWMIIPFGIGITSMEDLFKIRKITLKFRKHEKTFRTEKVSKSIATVTIIVTVFLLSINYYEYVIRQDTYLDKRVMQYKENGKLIEKISNKLIQQSFKTSKPFNSVSIKFKKMNVKGETHYNFILRNDEGKILVNQSFTSNSIINNNLKAFYFDEIKPKGNQKYIIEIKSDDATEENSLGIGTFYQTNYTAYLDGDLSINGEKSEADLTFQVQNKITRSYTTSRVYLSLSVIIIIIETIAFYPYLKIKKRKNINFMKK